MFNAFKLTFPGPPTELELHLACFLHDPKPEDGGLGKAEHFWRVVEILWPEKYPNGKNNPCAFIRNPWAEKMAIETARRPTLAVIGGLNSNKTDFYSVWGLVSWLADAWGTMVLLVSTTIDDSKRRMWGSVKKYFQGATVPLPGKLVDSMRTIRTDDGSGKSDDKCGIQLIAGVKSKEKEAVGKLIGIKQGRLLFICDELPELSPALAEAYFSNLAPSNPNAQMVGIGNFASIYDPLGTLSTPKGGWGSVSPEDTEWECDRGVYCIRFDGLKSPNLILGEDKYPFLYSSKSLAKHREAYGDNSAEFWRMCRSFPCPEGVENVLYSESELLNGRAMDRIPSADFSWLGPRTRMTTLDPSYTNGGDRSVQWFGWWGVLNSGLWVLCYDKFILLREDVTLSLPRDYQIVRQFRDNAKREGVAPDNAAFDGTAASGFASIVFEEWSPRVMKVEFGGAASNMRVSVNDSHIAAELYDRRVSELWGVGREFLRAGQLKGMTADLCKELKARQYETAKRGGNVMVVVETKRDMKKRLGFSPDLADSALIMLELCRRRFGALAGGISTGIQRSRSDFFAVAKEKDKVYHELYAEPDSE